MSRGRYGSDWVEHIMDRYHVQLLNDNITTKQGVKPQLTTGISRL